MRQEITEEIQQLLKGTPSEYEAEISHRDAPLIQSPQRWCATLGYFLCASSIGILMSTTWLNSDSFAKLFVDEAVLVEPFSLVFFGSPLLFALFASYTISVDSLTTSLTIGVLLCSIGAWFRSFVDDNLIVAFIGQCIASVGVSFFLSAPSVISARWFFPANRGTATLLMTLSPLIFAYLGPIFATLAIHVPSSSLTTSALNSYYRHRAIYATLSGCVGLLLFQQSPPSPPAHSESLPRHPFSTSLKLLFSHKSFLFATVSSALSISLFISFNLFSVSLLQAKGMDRHPITMLYLINILVAVALVLFFAFLYRLLQRAKPLLLISQIGILITLIIALAWAQKEANVLLAVLLIIETAFFSPIMGLTLELLADITFPIGGAISASFLLGAVSLFSLLLGIAQHYLLQPHKRAYFFILSVILQVVALLILIFVKGKRVSQIEQRNPRKLADSDDFVLFKQPDDEEIAEESHAVPQ